MIAYDLLVKGGNVIDGTGAPAMRDLVNVETIPFEVLDAGITWDWESFPEYMDAAARRRPAVHQADEQRVAPWGYHWIGAR